MPRDPRYDILFEPIRIGPVTAPNRFYQVPHCTGMGYARPQTLAAMRGVKAEGGWGVISTEYCSVHPTSEDDPMPTSTLWDEEDVRASATMVESVHRHGGLAAAELWHGGNSTSNLLSRNEGVSVKSLPAWYDPVQCRTLDKSGIRELRDALYHALHERIEIERVGDCSAPGIIASAVYSGHRYARAMDLASDSAIFRRERALAPTKTASS